MLPIKLQTRVIIIIHMLLYFLTIYFFQGNSLHILSFAILLISYICFTSHKGLSITKKWIYLPFKKMNDKNVYLLISLITYISFILLVVFLFFMNPDQLEVETAILFAFFVIIIRQSLKVIMDKDNITHELAKMEIMAKYDCLTGLPNRNEILKYVDKSINSNEYHTEALAVMFIDLDRFKFINDTMGHEVGDLLLIDVSKRLKDSIRGKGIVARQGGDEFIILLNVVDQDEVTQIAEDIIDNFNSAFHLQGKEVYTTPSIGISMYPHDAENKEDLIKNADIAMYYSKREGKNSYYFYSNISDTINRKLAIEEELGSALENNNLYLEYQPQYDLVTKQISGLEALLRWEHPKLGMIRPDEFIPIAEYTGLIIPIGKWVLQKVCQQIKAIENDGYPPIKVAVNISSLQFKDPNFINDVKNIIQKTQLDPRLLEFEITESFMENINETKIVIHDLKKMGISISIDDFGAGYSSLTLLHQLPIDRIKIDRSFINEMLKNSKTASLVQIVIEMGYNLNLELVAEGIETEAQEKELRKLKCQVGQGFLFSPPLKSDEIKSVIGRFINVDCVNRN